MKRKSKDIARKRKRLKVGETRRKSIDKGLFKDRASLDRSLMDTAGEVYWQGGIPKVADRTWGEYGAEWGGAAAGTAVGALAGGPMGAFSGYTAGTQGVRAIQWGQRAYNAKGLFDKENIKIEPLMSVSYGGKMRKSIGKSTSTIRKKYQGKGAVVINEIYGAVSDADVLGVGHITWQIDSVARAVAYALFRKLFLSAGIVVQTPYEVIRMIDQVQSGGYRISMFCQDADNTPQTTDYIIPINSTMETIFASSGINLILQLMMTGQNPFVLERVLLLMNNDRIVSQIYTRQQVLDVTINVHTVIQNRTKTVTGSSSTDSVDAQPLKGPIFQFNGIPKTKEISPLALNIIPFSGVILFRKSQLSGSDPNAWSEPPVKQSFYNATKGSYVRLAPGVLKDMEVAKTWVGPFQLLFNRWRQTFESNTINACPGISQVAFLEEELNSGSANLMNVAYETQQTFGALLYTSKAPNMQPFYLANNYNNLPA